jgi:hypothetical protein
MLQIREVAEKKFAQSKGCIYIYGHQLAHMKKINILYWVFTGLLAVLMLLSAIPSLLETAQSMELTSKHLGYPVYFSRFLGVAKLLGVIALVVPGYRRLKEWAYAGFAFDLIAAAYSFLAVGDSPVQCIAPVIGLVILALSYWYFHKRG